MHDRYPPEVEALLRRVASLPGVVRVSSTVQSLQGVTGGDLGLVDLGSLPHAALRRTDGGLANEVLVQIEFFLDESPEAWRTLEFLAWFIRDQGRGGKLAQLRPFGLPPLAGERVQLGRSLRFHIDLFVISPDGSLDPALQRVADMDEVLRLALKMYGHLWGADQTPSQTPSN